MKSRKVILDRPTVDSKEIQSHKNFDRVLDGHKVMAKPFYKNAWFFGTTGVASIGLIIGGGMALQNQENSTAQELNLVHTDAPPELTVPDNSLIAMNGMTNELPANLVKKTLAYGNYQELTNQEETTNEATSTLDQNQTSEENTLTGSEENTTTGPDNSATTYAPTGVEVNDRTGYSRVDLHPRISGKINGSITRSELLDGKGITTEADVNIIHFELHLIDGLGGKVFEEEGNQLNEEMKAAIDRVLGGETIYFENIHGESQNGDVVKLNPLRYVLLN